MTTRLFLCLFAMLLSCFSSAAQQSQPQMQPLTFWYEYTVNPGKEEEFMDLVKTVGQPVRDKLMADGVVMAWGVQTPLLRVPGEATHTIWYAVADYAGLEKVDSAMRAQIAKLNDEATKSGVAKKGQKPAASLTARLGEVADMSKVHDYLTRDLVDWPVFQRSRWGFAVHSVQLSQSETRQGRRIPQGLGEVQQAGIRQATG